MLNTAVTTSYLTSNKIEIHYWLENNSHKMNALVQNKCEQQVLALIQEVARVFDVEMTIETEPIAEGGIRRWFSFKSLKKSHMNTVKVAVVTSLAIGLITTPISTSLTKVLEKVIEEKFSDEELKALEKELKITEKEIQDLEKEKLEIELNELKEKAQFNSTELSESPAIKKRKSNFYEALSKEKKIEKISYSLVDEEDNTTIDSFSVDKKDFESFILVTDDLDPVTDENALIEIVAPVLKKGKYKWIGIYNGETIHFNMKSNEFKQMVQSKEVEFKNGFSIECHLVVSRKVTNEGEVSNSKYDIISVHKYFVNDTPIETPEGKINRDKKKRDKDQYPMFPSNDSPPSGSPQGR